MPVQKDMEFTGYFAAHLYVSTDEADDADLFVYVVKQDETGRLLPPVVKEMCIRDSLCSGRGIYPF